ncbi:general secretion pathway protein GspC [Pseudomonas sp. Fl5BN2]|uniref:type II secretion system protein N n=1 Tax=Pseudomonas sp. Fl5BN2 TaxID=2697652 RepID=UPI0013774B1D|nr:type II secretion system protein N [Pseudomonas sp. Fl5BN2]NBF02232.1 general secretion pathway protein GspC [Pseudomonas sp. Fl5BN2]
MLSAMLRAPGFSAPQLLQYTALLAALAGVVTWSSLLLTPAASPTPALAPQVLAAGSDNPALQWFSNQPTQVQIKVAGVMAGGRGAVAILQLNDGPPRSFLAGEQLTQGVRLAAIEGDGVLIERGGEQSRIKVSKLPDPPSLPRLRR